MFTGTDLRINLPWIGWIWSQPSVSLEAPTDPGSGEATDPHYVTLHLNVVRSFQRYFNLQRWKTSGSAAEKKPKGSNRYLVFKRFPLQEPLPLLLCEKLPEDAELLWGHRGLVLGPRWCRRRS